MKRKLGSILRVGTAMLLALSMALVTTAPARANGSGVTATPSTLVTGANATYTIDFTISASLQAISGTITVTFPANTTVPATGTYANGAISVNGTAVAGGDVTVSGMAVTIKTPVALVAPVAVQVVFTLPAGIKNSSTEGASIVKVKTSAETTDVDSSSFTLVDPPTVTNVRPPQGNRGENITVVITGDDLTGATAVTFTSGVTVTGFAVTSDTAISANITIPADATIETTNVTVTTAVGSDTEVGVIVVAANTAKVDRYNSSGVYVANYDTIQAAITAASASDKLKVHAAAYTEAVTVNKAGLTIESYMGAASTTVNITGGQTSTPTIDVVAASITIGSPGKGFTLMGTPTGSGNAVIQAGLNAAATSLTLDSNIIVANWVGIYVVGSYSTTGLNVKNNTIVAYGSVTTGETTGITLWMGDGTTTTYTATIDGNSFTLGDGTTTHQVDSGISLNRGGVRNITNNTFEGMGKRTYDGSAKGAGAIEISDDPLGAITISGNTMTNNKYAVVLDDFGGGTSRIDINYPVVIKQNTMTGNTYGIKSKTTTAGESTITIKYNDITNSTTNGIWWVVGEDVIALHNWWGSAAGPKDTTSNPNGVSTATVTTGVTYSPWLAAAQAGIVSALKSQYASSVVMSAANAAVQTGDEWNGGWTTFSPTRALDGAGDTWGEVTTLANLTYNVAYSWDGTNFVLVTTNSTISPLSAVFVQLKTSATQSLPVLYKTSGVPAPDSRLLSAGWQVIGLAGKSGTDQRDSHLASLSGKFSQVLDANDGTIIAAATAMSEGRGYWVFMTSAATLAGFNTAPVTFVAVP